MTENFDVAVIGAGPAGLAAATEAASHGLSVVLFDEQPAPGGQIYRNIEGVDRRRLGKILDEDYLKGADIAKAFRASSADYRSGATVWRVDTEGSLAWTNGSAARITNAKRVISATGALERPVPVPGWTLPGVMGAGAAQILLKTAGMVPDGPTVIAGNGPLLYLVANQLFSAGTEIAAILETTRFRDYLGAARYAFGALKANEYLSKGNRMMQELKRKGLRVQSGTKNIRADGNEKLKTVRFTANHKEYEIEASTLLLHQGVVPNVQITRQMGATHEWYEPQRYWRPVTDEWGATSGHWRSQATARAYLVPRSPPPQDSLPDWTRHIGSARSTNSTAMLKQAPCCASAIVSPVSVRCSTICSSRPTTSSDLPTKRSSVAAKKSRPAIFVNASPRARLVPIS